MHYSENFINNYIITRKFYDLKAKIIFNSNKLSFIKNRYNRVGR